MRVIRKGKKKRPRSTLGAISGGRFKNEHQFQKHVIQRALGQGWAVFHQGDSRTQLIGHGFPDLTMINRRAARILIAELKMPGGEVYPEQVEWGALFLSLSQFIPQLSYHFWFPKDMHKIEKTLIVADDPARAAAFAQAVNQLQEIIKGLAR